MMAILSLSLFACGSKDTTSSSNGSARTNTEKEADTKNENVGTFSQLFTNNDVSVWYSCEAIDKEETPSVYVMYGDGTYLKLGTTKSKTFADLSKMTDEEIASWVEEDWNNRNEVLMYYKLHKDELKEDARNSLPDSVNRDSIVTIALDDAYMEITGTTSAFYHINDCNINRIINYMCNRTYQLYWTYCTSHCQITHKTQ